MGPKLRGVFKGTLSAPGFRGAAGAGAGAGAAGAGADAGAGAGPGTFWVPLAPAEGIWVELLPVLDPIPLGLEGALKKTPLLESIILRLDKATTFK